MAGSIIALPNLGDSDWSSFITIVEKTNRGFNGISLSAIDTTSAPTVIDGSIVEVNGAIFQFTTAETITGWPSAATVGDDYYIVIVPAGTVATAVFTASAPTWSETKGGWYDSNDRYVGGLAWGGSATYLNKYLIENRQDLISSYRIKQKVVEIGDWNMQGTAGNTVDVAHGIDSAQRIRGARGWIRDDTEATFVPIPNCLQAVNGTITQELFFMHVGADTTNIRLGRLFGGQYDGVTYNSTSFNRGWLIIEYE